MELLAYFRAIRRHWAVILACVVAGALVGVLSTRIGSGADGESSRSFHRATHTLFFDPSLSTTLFSSAFSNLDQMATLATRGPVPNAAAETLAAGDSGRELAEQITTLSSPTTSTLEITAVDRDGERAVELSDAFADALVADLLAKDTERYEEELGDAREKVDELRAEVELYGAQLQQDPPNAVVLQAQLVAASTRLADAVDHVEQIEDAEAPESALSTLEAADAVPIDESEYDARLSLGRLGTNNLQAGAAATLELDETTAASSSALEGDVPRGLFGAFLGLLVGVGIALFIERVDRRIRTRETAEAAYEVPVLADVPLLAGKEQHEHAIVAHDAPVSPTAEAYRAVRSAVLFQHAVGMAAAAVNGDAYTHDTRPGPSFDSERLDPIIVMVASASPKEGKTTTSANLAAVFAETGSSVLVVNCDFRRPMIHTYLGVEDTPRRVVTTRIDGVKAITNVLPDSDANPARVIAEQRRLINAARGQFDVMNIDTAPLLSANDAVELVGSADIVVLVAKAGESTITDARRAMEMLERVHAPIAGVVLLGASEAPNAYYNYYRGQAAPEPSRRERRKAKRAAPSTNGIGEAEPDAPADTSDEVSTGEASPT